MASHNLTQTRRNAILGSILEAGLDPNDFAWEERTSSVVQVGPGRDPYTVEVLQHRPTGYWFKFDVNNRGSLWALWMPGPEGSLKRDHAGTWEYVLSYAKRWLQIVKAEHEAVDMWAAIGNEQELLEVQDVEDTPFSPDEQALVAAQLQEAKEFARATLALEPAQLERIEAQLDYLTDLAERGARRVEWRNALVGSLVSLALQTIVPVGAIQQLLGFVLRGVAGAFGGGGTAELPGGPPELM